MNHPLIFSHSCCVPSLSLYIGSVVNYIITATAGKHKFRFGHIIAGKEYAFLGGNVFSEFIDFSFFMWKNHKDGGNIYPIRNMRLYEIDCLRFLWEVCAKAGGNMGNQGQIESKEVTELKERIGKNIRFLREKRGLKQNELGNQICISQPNISQYEGGKKTLPLDRIVQISNFFNVELESLMFQELDSKSEHHEELELPGLASVQMLPEFDSNETKLSESDPIRKCANRTYYCYYVREYSDEKQPPQIASFEMKVLAPQSPNKAQVEIKMANRSAKQRRGQIIMDESYAYVECHDFKRDFFFVPDILLPSAE